MKRRLISIIVVLQIIFLLGLAFSYYAIDMFGEEIVLETAPVDPRDLFYGDYVILSYEISEIDSEKLSGDWDKNRHSDDTWYDDIRGKTVYTVLRPDSEGVYRLQFASVAVKPELADDEVMLKGTAEYAFRNALRVKYGLERYYVPEGTGADIEELRAEMKVKVAVAPWGQAKVNALLLPE